MKNNRRILHHAMCALNNCDHKGMMKLMTIKHRSGDEEYATYYICK